MQKENDAVHIILSSPSPRRTGESGVSRFFVSDGRASVRNKIGRCRITTLRQDIYFTGFTLIELLVVVLIIGILAAVALPQYQKSVEKSKATQAITLLKSVYQAADAYYLANGTWPTSFDVLDVDIPWTGHTVVYGGSTDPRSNNDWSLEIFKIGSQHGIVVTRLNGKYKGGQFAIYKRNGSSLVPPDTLLCQEEKASTSYIMETAGLYCQQLFQGTYITQGSGNRLYFFGK